MFHHAKQHTRSGDICIEECIEGVEVGGDGILVDGKLAFVAITHKYFNGLVVTGHRLPTNISTCDQQRVVDALETCCRTMGYLNGPLNFDVLVSDDAATIIEMSPRNGGNGIPSVIERATGMDVETATLQHALNQPWQTGGAQTCYRGCGSLVFGSMAQGKLKSACAVEEISREIEEVFELVYAVRPGERVRPFVHNGNLIGYVLFDCDDSAHYENLCRHILDFLDISVTS